MSDVVLFSGGCDSTLVLYKRLMNAQKHIGGIVKAISISHDQVGAQKEQARARERILAEFKKRELHNFLSIIDVHITHTSGGVATGGLAQPPVWFLIAASYLASGDILYTGYHSGDDFWRRRHEMEEAFKTLSIVGEKSTSVEHILAFNTKAEIILELKERGLYDLCWYCEGAEFHMKDSNPLDEPCGKCFPCKTHKTALWQISEFAELKNPPVSNNIIQDKIVSPTIENNMIHY